MNNREAIKVVLVDDDDDDRQIFREAIEELDMNVDLALFHTGYDLPSHIKNGDALPNIIFLDINMPFMSGIECLKELRSDESLKDLTIVMYSTSSSENNIDEAFTCGANIYIVKPNSFSVLQRTLKDVMKMQSQLHNFNRDRDNFVYLNSARE